MSPEPFMSGALWARQFITKLMAGPWVNRREDDDKLRSAKEARRKGGTKGGRERDEGREGGRK